MAAGLLAHAATGDGAPLLLLNGGLMTFTAWDPVVPALTASCRVLRCDFRGQLQSPGQPPSSLEGHVADLLSLLDSLEVDSVHVAGVSFGALVAIVLAGTAPARVRSLTACNATEKMTVEMNTAATGLANACRDAAATGDGGRVLDFVNPTTWSPGFLAAQAAMFAARREAVEKLPSAWFSALEALSLSLIGLDLRPLLPKVTCPTLILGGEKDATFPVEHSHELAAHIHGSRLVVIAGGTHGMVVEQAPTVIGHLLTFVQDTERARPV